MTTGPLHATPKMRSRRSFAQMPRREPEAANEKENMMSLSTTARGAKSAAASGGTNSSSSKKDRKARSKSLGPGGLDLDTLKPGGASSSSSSSSSSSRRKSATQVPLKSILKPAVPLSPVRDIPSYEEIRQRTPNRRGSSPQKQINHNNNNNHGNSNNNSVLESGDLLIDFSTPSPPAATDVIAPTTPAEAGSNPFDAFSPASVLRNYRMPMAAAEEEENAAAAATATGDERTREEKEQAAERERQKQAAEHREARRKSLANRRVSFAPEATLHTWNVAELAEDSTSSSGANATPSTHSNAEQQQQRQQQQSPASVESTPETHANLLHSSDSEFAATSSPERPSTPTQTQTHDLEVMSPAADPLALYRKSTRRDYAAPSNSPKRHEKVTSRPRSPSPPAIEDNDSDADGDATMAEETVHEEEEEEEEVEEEQVDGDGEDGEGEEAFDSESDPGDTIVSDNPMVHSPVSSVDSSAAAQLEQSVQQDDEAEPGPGVDMPRSPDGMNEEKDDDDGGDMSMDFTEIQGAFQPWVKKSDAGSRRASVSSNKGADTNVDQENIYPSHLDHGRSPPQRLLPPPPSPRPQTQPQPKPLQPSADKENLVPRALDKVPTPPSVRQQTQTVASPSGPADIDAEREEVEPDNTLDDQSAVQQPESMAEVTAEHVEQEQTDENERPREHVNEVPPPPPPPPPRVIEDAERAKKEAENEQSRAKAEELKALKRNTRNLQRKCGWEIIPKVVPGGDDDGKPHSKLLTLRYRDELLVTLNPESFATDAATTDGGPKPEAKKQEAVVRFEIRPSNRLHSWFSSSSSSSSAVNAMALDFLRTRSAEVLSSNNNTTSTNRRRRTAKAFLASVARAWDKARSLSHEVRMLRFLGLTRTRFVKHTKDGSLPTDALRVRCMLLRPQHTDANTNGGGNSGTDHDRDSDGLPLTPSKKRKASEEPAAAPAPTPKSARNHHNTTNTNNPGTKPNTNTTTSTSMSSMLKKSRLDIDFTIVARPASDAPVDVDIEFDLDVAAARVYGPSATTPTTTTTTKGGRLNANVDDDVTLAINNAFRTAEMRRGGSAAKEFGNGVWLEAVRRLDGVAV